MHEGSYCTYMMASRSRTLYVGVTGDLLKRVFQHKGWRRAQKIALIESANPALAISAGIGTTVSRRLSSGARSHELMKATADPSPAAQDDNALESRASAGLGWESDRQIPQGFIIF
jgi:hypothetical protein